MYVSGREAAISGETRSVVKRPTSSPADRVDSVVCIWVTECAPVDFGEAAAMDGRGEVSLVMIANVADIEVRGGLAEGALWFCE